MDKKQFIKNRPFDENDALDMQNWMEIAIKNYSKQFFTKGIITGFDVQTTTGMGLKVTAGILFDNNFTYINNTSDSTISLSTADTQDRIDMISIKYKQNSIDNIDTANKYGRGTSWNYSKNLLDSFDVIIRKGTPSATPIKPTVPSDEFALASILVKANGASLISGNITKEAVMSQIISGLGAESPVGAQSKADAVTSWVKSFGLGDLAKDISGTDLNVLDMTGFYRGNNLANSPNTSNFYYIINMKHATTYKGQIAILLNNSTPTYHFRINNSGTWTSWFQLATNAIVTTTLNGLMIAADKTKLDGIAIGANNYVHPANHPPSIITQDSSNRFVTDTEKTTWNGKANNTQVTQTADGIMIYTDKVKLDGISTGANKATSSATNGNVKIDGTETVVYTHPANHPPSIITQDASNRFVTDTEKTTWNGKAPTTAVTTGANGLMIAADKAKLDGMMIAMSATLPATLGWYRIATSAVDIGRNSGRFEIDWTLSGNHGQVILNAGVMYGTDVSIELNQLQYAPYATTVGLTQARIVYHNTNTANYAYLEVYNASAAAIIVNVQMFSSLGWSLVAPSTAGSIPSGYKSTNLTFISGISTAGQFRSDVAVGTAPMVITSTTVITNLNADMVDGAHAGTAANNVLKLDASAKVPVANLPTATTAVVGGVQLTDSTSSTSTTTAATPNSVKIAYDKANAAETTSGSQAKVDAFKKDMEILYWMGV